MFATLKEYIKNSANVARQTQLNAGIANPCKSMADYVLELSDQDLALFEEQYAAHKNGQPFRGKRILFNQHQDRITWALMLLHQALGAEVEASQIGVSELSFAAEALKAAGVPYYQHAHKLPRAKNHYALGYDCGGGLCEIGLTTKHGFIELTYTNPDLYKDIKFPVTTINNSITKLYETYCGTGQAVIDAIRPEVYKNLAKLYGADNLDRFADLLSSNGLSLLDLTIKSKYWVIVGGAGKVAAGLIRSLINQGVAENHILLLDPAPQDAFITRMDKNTHVRFLKASLDNLPDLKTKILTHIQSTSLPSTDKPVTPNNFSKLLSFVTATGAPGLMTTKNIHPEDFPGADFINAQHCDGYGHHFRTGDLVGNTRSAVNFNTDWLETKQYPTKPRYVIPSLILMARQGLTAIKTIAATPGLKDVPMDADQEIYNAAKRNYNDGNEFALLDGIAAARFTEPTEPFSPAYSSSSSMTDTAPPSVPPSPERPRRRTRTPVGSVQHTFLTLRNTQGAGGGQPNGPIPTRRVPTQPIADHGLHNIIPSPGRIRKN